MTRVTEAPISTASSKLSWSLGLIIACAWMLSDSAFGQATDGVGAGDAGTPLTNLAQIKAFIASDATNGQPVALEATLLLADSVASYAVLSDETGRARIEMDLPAGQTPRPGERLRVTGTVRVERGQATLRSLPLIVNPITRIRNYITNSIHLPAGYHSIEIGHVQGSAGKQLDVEYSGPGISRRRVPPSVLFYSVVNPDGTRGYEPGLTYAYYEGYWNTPPLFAALQPTESGVLPGPTVTPTNWVRDFAVRFAGFVRIDDPGIYTFFMRADDAGELRVGDEMNAAKLEIAGSGPLPRPLALRIGQDLAPEQEWQLAEVEGTVTFVGQEGSHFLIELTEGNLSQQVHVIGGSIAEMIPLLDCRVRVRGVASPAFNDQDEVVLGTMFVQGCANVQIQQVPPHLWREIPIVDLPVNALATNEAVGSGPVQLHGELADVTEEGVVLDVAGIKVTLDARRKLALPAGASIKGVGFLRQENGVFRLVNSFCEPTAPRSPTRDAAQLPVLTSGIQIYSLSAEEAAREYPVRLKGVITSPMPLRIQDATRAAYVARRLVGGFQPAMGEVYVIEGVTGPGRFAPTVQLTRATLKGPGVMPQPLHPTYDQLMSLSDCVQWAELEGVIQGAYLGSSLASTNNRRGDLVLATRGGIVLLSVGGNSSSEWAANLEDARVRVRGTIAARFNDRRQNLGAYLSVPSPAYICVVKPGPVEPFQAPLRKVADLMGFESRAALLNRVRVAGQITHVADGLFYLTDQTNGVVVRPRDMAGLSVGDLVEVAGYQDMSIAAPTLQEALVRQTGRRPLPEPDLCTVNDLINGERNSTRIRLTARTLNLRTNGNERIFDLQSGLRSFHARMDLSRGALPSIPQGSLVEFTGLCAGNVVHTAHGLELESFDVLLNSPADIRLLELPPRWTVGDALMVIAALSGFILLAVLWITLLRRRVDHRTRQLRHEIENHKSTELQLQAEIEERKRIQREVEEAHKELVRASRIAGMAEVATGVLHNVGNVLNTVNISADIVTQRIQQSRLQGLSRLAQLFERHNGDFARFVAEDPAAMMVPSYIRQLDQYFREEQESQQHDLHLLRKSVDHIKEIVAMQQSYARSSALFEKMSPVEAVEEALRLQEGALARHSVKVVKEYETIEPFLIDKHKLLQILINLLTNAKYACDERGDTGEKQITVRVLKSAVDRVQLQVQDNGIGIAPENLERIFTQGFTTRPNGHGFGLHSSAIAAREMGGSMTVHSDGLDQGALFSVEIPIREEVNAPSAVLNGANGSHGSNGSNGAPVESPDHGEGI